MSEKKSRFCRKLVSYNPGDDPIHERKYAIVVCNKVIVPSKTRPARARSGQIVVNKGKRLQYRAAKKLYRRGLI